MYTNHTFFTVISSVSPISSTYLLSDTIAETAYTFLKYYIFFLAIPAILYKIVMNSMSVDTRLSNCESEILQLKRKNDDSAEYRPTSTIKRQRLLRRYDRAPPSPSLLPPGMSWQSWAEARNREIYPHLTEGIDYNRGSLLTVPETPCKVGTFSSEFKADPNHTPLKPIQLTPLFSHVDEKNEKKD
jgi:hypothetical protein